MTLSPYRQQDETWYQLYLQESAENSALQNQLWALQRENAELRVNQLTRIFVVHIPANDNEDAVVLVEDRICLNAAIVGAAIMFLYILMFV